jgi:hypothetical protein
LYSCSPAVPTADDGGTSGDIRIPAFALDVDLSGLAVIRIESVRRVARFLKTQDMPREARHRHDLAQPLVFALNQYAVDPESDRAGLAHWLYNLGMAFIFFRTAGTRPLTTAELRGRAALTSGKPP